MIILLFVNAASVYMEIDRFNAITLLQDRPNMKAMFFLFNPTCPHCAAARPAWMQFAKNNENIDGVVIGEVNCLENGNFCGKFEEAIGYPQWVFWDRANNLSICYQGSRTSKSFEDFLQKNIGPPVTFINNEHEVFSTSKSEQYISRFLLKTKNETKERTYSQIVYSFPHFRPLFFGMKVPIDSLVSFRGDNITSIYSGNWTRESIKNFANKNQFSAFPALTSPLLKYFANKSPILVFLLKNSSQKSDFVNIVASVHHNIQCAFTIFVPGSYVVRLAGVMKHQIPCIVALKNMNFYKRYSGIVNAENLNKWVTGSVQIEKKWKGGNGAIASLNVMFNSALSGEMNSLVGAILVVVTICCLIFFLISKSFSRRKYGMLYQTMDKQDLTAPKKKSII